MKTITVLLTTVLFSMSASAALTPACEEYYKEIDNFVAKMKEMGTPEAQVNTLKQQYEQSRKQIAALLTPVRIWPVSKDWMHCGSQ